MFEVRERAEKVVLRIDESIVEVPAGTSLHTLVIKRSEKDAIHIMGAKFNNRLIDLYEELYESGDVEWLDLNTDDGMRIYKQSLVFLLTKAAYELFPQRKVIVMHTLGQSFYCEFKETEMISSLDIIALEAKMREIVADDEPILPQTLSRENACRMLAALGHEEKAVLLDNLGWEKIKLNTSGYYSNFSFGILAPSTGGLNVFKLQIYERGFLLRFADETDISKVAPYPDLPKLEQVFRESKEWARIMNTSNMAGYVQLLAKDKKESSDLIHIAEALHEKKIARIADEIFAQRDKLRLILIAGPSSSGKTTFAHRLSIQLRALGLRPISISLDDYFVNREDTPLDENGEYNFEALEAVDISLFNKHLQLLITGHTVDTPVFNFHLGAREKWNRRMQVEEGNPIIIEGIHGLNERLTCAIPRQNKFKIYISALTHINIDDHNYIPTTDSRLIRRIVRDNKFRSQNAITTLQRWPSVRRGEENNIFPFQEDADTIFNSALIYELSVLKKYAFPLLKEVEPREDVYSDACRLLRLLNLVPEIADDVVPFNSILREFVGGSSI